jgi:sugar lactone lactonase YvrE
MRNLRRALVGLAVAGLVVGQGPGAAAGPVTPDPANLHEVAVVASFPSGDYGAFAESMAPDGRGGMIVSVTQWGPEDGSTPNMGQLWRVGPDGSMSTFGPQMDLSPAGMLMGVAVDDQGRVFVVFNNFGSDYGLAEDPPSGVLRVTPGHARRVLPLPDDAPVNGLAEHEGTLYVTDSRGSVWTGSSTGAAAFGSPWFASGLLEPTQDYGFGANGIAYRRGAIYVTSYDQGLIVKIPVRADGTPGTAVVVANDPLLVAADGIAFDHKGQLWAATNGTIDWAHFTMLDPGRVAMVDTQGVVMSAPTPAESLDYPTQVLPGQAGSLFVLNGSFVNGAPSLVAFTG